MIKIGYGTVEEWLYHYRKVSCLTLIGARVSR